MSRTRAAAPERAFDLLDHVPMGVFVLQQDLTILFWNARLEEWAGISRNRAIGTQIGTLFPHLKDPKYTGRLQSVFREGTPVIFSSQLHKCIIPAPLPDGQLRVQHTTVTAIPTSSGEGFHALFAIQDITDQTRRVQEYRTVCDQALEETRERKRAEEALRESEERYRTLFESAGDAIFIHDLHGRLLEVNQVASERLGYSGEEMLEMTLVDIESPEHAGSVSQHLEQLRQHGQAFYETVHICRDGTRISVELNSNIIEYRGSSAVLSIARDTTERKWAEEALRESEARYRTLFDSAGDAIFIYDLEGYFLGVNQVACERLGYNQEELLQMTAMDIGSPEHAASIEERLEQLHQHGQTFYETVHVHRDGTSIPVELNSRIIEYRGIPAVLSIARDITERKQAEKALRRSQVGFRAVAETANDAIITVDNDGKIVFWNPAAESVFGHSAQEAIGRSIDLILPQRLRGRFQQGIKRVVSSQRSKVIGATAMTTGLRKNGGEFPMEFSRAMWSTSDGVFFTDIIRDITERKRAEEALHKAKDELELRVEERTLELTIANEKLREEIAERRRAEKALRESEKALHRQLEELIVLHTIATAAAEATREDTLIERAVQAIDKLLYTNVFGVALLDEATGVLYTHPSHRPPPKTITRLGQDIAVQVAGDGQPRRLPDPTRESAHTEGDPPAHSQLCVPLKTGDQILGVINAESSRANAFHQADERLLITFASQLATAIQRVRLMETLEQRVAARTGELQTLYEVTAVASESLDLRTTLARSLDRAVDAVAGHAGAIHLLDEDEKTLHLAAHQGTPADIVACTDSVDPAECPMKWVIENRVALIAPDITTDPRMRPTILAPGLYTYIGVPMQARGRVLGVLSLIREAKRQFSAEEIALLTSIAGHVGVAVENARLRQQAERTAVTEERERLARELHDSVTQSLYSLTLFAEAGLELAQSEELEQVKHYLNRISETSQQSLKDMRLLVYRLRPEALERQGLVGALRQRLEAVERRASLEVHLLADELIELPASIEEGLYRIAQEALNNSLKHAMASSVMVRIQAEGPYVMLEVADDGIGCEPDTTGERGGLGLISMRERAEELGGVFTVVSAPGEGMVIRVEINGQQEVLQ